MHESALNLRVTVWGFENTVTLLKLLHPQKKYRGQSACYGPVLHAKTTKEEASAQKGEVNKNLRKHRFKHDAECVEISTLALYLLEQKHCFGSHFGLQAFKFDSQVYLVRDPNTSLNRIEIHVCLFSSSSLVRKLITSSNSHIIRCLFSPSQDNDGQLLLYTIVNANLFSCVTGAIELQSTHDDDIIITNLLMLYSNPLRLMGSQIHLFIHSLLI